MTHARIGSGRLDIDLPLADGITALLGPAGAGKTATLEAIAGFTRPERGRILIDDAIVFGSRRAFAELNGTYGGAARSLGSSEWRIFWRVILPLGWRSILAAAAIGFLRVLAEWTIVAAL